MGSDKDTDSGSFLICETTAREEVVEVFKHEETGLRSSRIKRWQEESIVEVTRLKGRKIDLFFPNDQKIGIEVSEVQLEDNPFHLIRIADNLDFADSRRSELQKMPSYENLCKQRYRRYELERLIEGCDDKEELKGLLKEKRVVEKTINKLVKSEELKEVAGKIDEKSFKHFGGLAPITGVQISTINKNAFEISVFVKQGKWEELEKHKFEENVDAVTYPVSIARYQLFRLFKAMRKIKLGQRFMSQSLKFRIFNETNDEISTYRPK